MRYCQGPRCHEYRTKDRIRGHKGDKHYETRKRSEFYYGKSNFCSLNCQNDWFNKFGDMAINHFGRINEPKRLDCENAWYKDYRWLNDVNHQHYFINDLLGERVRITQEQYRAQSFVRP